MKTALISFLMLISSAKVFATVDGMDHFFVVVQNIQDDQDFFLERAPLVGCYGLPQGPRLSAWNKEYKAISNIGCGGPTMYENINALTCAKVVDSKESDDFNSYSEITLDISGCSYKDNAKFVTMVRTSAMKNFPQTDKSKEVVLTLIRA